MTVTYTGEVATCTGFGCFWKLLFRWKGSIYKLLWPNLIVYSILYFGLSATYRFMLDSEQRNLFEKMSLHCQVYGDLIPVSFVLGFYVSLVIKRWWDQYLCLPWPDNLALFVSSLVHGQDERGRIMRRTIMRYVNLSLLLTLRMISPRVKKRFPTLDHVVEAGWMLLGEKKIFEDLEQKTFHVKYWMPLVWAGGIVTRARKEGRIKDDFALKTIIDELNTFRGGCGGMLNYDWISIPLVYTQVVTLAVYVFFLSTLMGSQFLDPSKNYPKHQIDLIFPAFTFLQFFFYMGWLKVAESLVNPFGEDDDDFELNWLLDRNLQISYVIVDEMHQEHPEMLKDQYWDEVFPMELPYTAAAKQYQTGPPQYSAEEVEVPSHQAEFMPLDCVFEENAKDNEMDMQNVDIEIDYSNVQRGETRPMKIRKRRSSSATNTASRQSSYSKKGKNSIFNLLDCRFSHSANSKEKMNKVESFISLNRRNNTSTSRLSIAHTVTSNRGSFARENVPYNDYQVEVFSMSDLDLPALIPTGVEDDKKRIINSDISQQSDSGATQKLRKDTDAMESDMQDLRDTSINIHKKEIKITINDDSSNFERKEASPTYLFYNDLFKRKDSIDRVIIQNNSPMYHIFAPVSSGTSKTSVSEEMKPRISSEAEKNERNSENLSDRSGKSSLCPENLITILPPTDLPQFPVTRAHTTCFEQSIEKTFFTKPESKLELGFRSSPNIGFSYDKQYSMIKESHRSPLCTCDTTSENITGSNISALLDQSWKSRCEKISEVRNIFIRASKIEDLKVTSEPATLNSNLSNSKLEEYELMVSDPQTGSVAIPVPALSQAHTAPAGDLKFYGVCRPIIHELEPIIEHRDEGVLVQNLSCKKQILNE